MLFVFALFVSTVCCQTCAFTGCVNAGTQCSGCSDPAIVEHTRFTEGGITVGYLCSFFNCGPQTPTPEDRVCDTICAIDHDTLSPPGTPDEYTLCNGNESPCCIPTKPGIIVTDPAQKNNVPPPNSVIPMADRVRCQSKRCKQAIGCHPLGFCQYNAAVDVYDNCCRVSADCPRNNPNPDPFLQACTQPNCGWNFQEYPAFISACTYSVIPDCCISDAQCTNAQPGTAQRGICVENPIDPTRRTCRYPYTPTRACSAPTPNSCQSANNICAVSTCNQFGSCAITPASELSTSGEKCCIDDSDSRCQQFKGPCEIFLFCNDGVPPAESSGTEAESFELYPTFECLYFPTTGQACCTENPSCAELSSRVECIDPSCNVADNACTLRETASNGNQCCYTDSECGRSTDLCSYNRCFGPPDETPNSNEVAFQCESLPIFDANPLDCDTAPAATPSISPQLDCTFDCNVPAEANTLFFDARILVPQDAEQVIYGFDIALHINSDNTPPLTSVIQFVEASILEITGRLIVPIPRQIPSGYAFTVDGAPPIFTGTEYRQVFKSPANMANDITLLPGDEVAVRFAIRLAAYNTMLVGVEVIPFDRCSSDRYFPDTVPACDDPTDFGNKIYLQPVTISTQTVFSPASCSAICPLVPTPSPPPGSPTPAPTEPPSSEQSSNYQRTIMAIFDNCAWECTFDSYNINRIRVNVTETLTDPQFRFTNNYRIFVRLQNAMGTDLPNFQSNFAVGFPRPSDITGDFRGNATLEGNAYRILLSNNTNSSSLTRTFSVSFYLKPAPVLGLFRYRVDVLANTNFRCDQTAANAGFCSPPSNQESFLTLILPPMLKLADPDPDAGECGRPCTAPHIIRSITSSSTQECQFLCASDSPLLLRNRLSIRRCVTNGNTDEPVFTAVLLVTPGSPAGAFSQTGTRFREDDLRSTTEIFEVDQVVRNASVVTFFSSEPEFVMQPTGFQSYCVNMTFFRDGAFFLPNDYEVRNAIGIRHRCTIIDVLDGICTNTSASARTGYDEVFYFQSSTFHESEDETPEPTECSQPCPGSPGIRPDEIGGRVFKDLQPVDGLFDFANEPPIAGVSVQAVDDINNIVVQTRTSNNFGVFRFNRSTIFALAGRIRLRILSTKVPFGTNITILPPPPTSEFIANAFFVDAQSSDPHTQAIFNSTLRSIFNAGFRDPDPCFQFFTAPPQVNDSVVIEIHGGNPVCTQCLTDRRRCTESKCGPGAVRREYEFVVEVANYGTSPQPAGLIVIEFAQADNNFLLSELLCANGLNSTTPGVGTFFVDADHAILSGPAARNARVYYRWDTLPANTPLGSPASRKINARFSWCASNTAMLFNVTAQIYGDYCIELLNNFTRCRNPRVDFRECFANRTATSTAPCPTTCPPTLAPTPRPGGGGSSSTRPLGNNTFIDLVSPISVDWETAPCITQAKFVEFQCPNATNTQCAASTDRRVLRFSWKIGMSAAAKLALVPQTESGNAVVKLHRHMPASSLAFCHGFYPEVTYSELNDNGTPVQQPIGAITDASLSQSSPQEARIRLTFLPIPRTQFIRITMRIIECPPLSALPYNYTASLQISTNSCYNVTACQRSIHFDGATRLTPFVAQPLAQCLPIVNDPRFIHDGDDSSSSSSDSDTSSDTSSDFSSDSISDGDNDDDNDGNDGNNIVDDFDDTDLDPRENTDTIRIVLIISAIVFGICIIFAIIYLVCIPLFSTRQSRSAVKRL